MQIDRPSVDRNVVELEHQQSGAGPLLDRRHPQRGVDSEVERGESGSLHSGGDRHRRSGQHDLVRIAVPVRVDRPERLVPADHVADREFECRDVELTARPQPERDVVRGRGRLEPVRDPQPPLLRGERDRTRPAASHNC